MSGLKKNANLFYNLYAKYALFIKHGSRSLITGGGAAVVFLVVGYVGIHYGHIPPLVSTVIAWFFSVCVSYTGNYFWTFTDKGKHSYAVPKFMVVALFALVMNFIIMYIFQYVIVHSSTVGLLVNFFCIPPVTFVINRFLIFTTWKQIG